MSLVLQEIRSLSEGSVAILTLNRPTQRNPLDKETVAQLNELVDGLIADPQVRALIITGSAPAFSAGGDLRGYLDLYQDEVAFRAFLATCRDLFDKLEGSRLLSIAAINGTCVAGGFELSLACDVIFAARGAKIGDGHLKFWQLPGSGGSQRLPRALGFSVAKRLLFSYELLPAEELHSMGLITKLTEPDDLIEEAVSFADRVTRAPEETIISLKNLLRVAAEEPLSKGLGSEIDEVVGYTQGRESAGYRGLMKFMNGG